MKNSKIDNPSSHLSKRTYNGKGIITASSAKFMFQTLISINILRDKGCTLPIELFYADEDEMNEADKIALELTLDVICINVQSFDEFANYNARNFSIKSIALYLSSFDETIWMDADIIPMMNFNDLFDVDHYKKHNHLFFNDIFSFEKNENSFSKKTISLFGEYDKTIESGTPETDSGLYMIHKSKFKSDLLAINVLLNTEIGVYENVYGDKELYRLSMLLCDYKYTTLDIYPCIIGKFFPSENLFCGNAVILTLDTTTQVAIHMTLHNVNNVEKYNNIWKQSFWSHYITKPVDVDLKIVEPLNQEIVLKYQYDTKFMSPLSNEIEIVQKLVFDYISQFKNNYLN